ncbi:MAG: hypothetical protein ACI8R4_004166 [Paracoccaceae bacterium]|jgi:hypothetical protein
MTQPKLDFNSPQELGQLLDITSRRLHFINRVSGESNYMWHLAEVIDAVGKLAALIEDKETSAAFGDGYSPGRLDRDERTDRILALLRVRL